MILNLANIIENDSVNSISGFTLSIWFQGCDNFCKSCHNPETWDHNSSKSKKFDFREIEVLIKKSYHSNVSISGGDPFFHKNINGLIELLKICKKYDKFVYVWTGKKYEDILSDKKMKRSLNFIDILIDGKFEIENKDLNLKLRGSKNQRIIDVQKSIHRNSIELYNTEVW